jgi:glycosyltransferase involved in cell wall biosynthesis
MKVTINALGTPSCRQGGAGFYMATLVDGLSREDSVGLLTLSSATVAAELEQLAPRAAVQVAAPRRRNPLGKAVNYLAAGRRPWTLDLGYSARLAPTDIVHWPFSFMNAPPPPDGARRVLTVHDLQHEFFPRFFSRRDRILRRLRWPTSARAADLVITISEFSKATLCDRYGIAAEKIAVVPLGARALGEPAEELPESLRGIERWFLYPASPLPAKNHARLFAALKRARHKDVKLVLTGPTMHPWRDVERQIAEAGVGGRVILLGHVDEAEMSRLYGEASGLIFPSLFEGFGLPVLEAMRAGCPVAVSNAGSLPEVAGEAGFSFDPGDVEQIAAGLDWLAGLDAESKQEAAAAGRAQAARFSVERMVAGTVDAYRRVLS